MKDFASFGKDDKLKKELSDEVGEVIKEFSGKSEKDMLSAVYERALLGKKNGTLTNEQIDAFYAQFAPMLDKGKRAKLTAVVEALKQISP